MICTCICETGSSIRKSSTCLAALFLCALSCSNFLSDGKKVEGTEERRNIVQELKNRRTRHRTLREWIHLYVFPPYSQENNFPDFLSASPDDKAFQDKKYRYSQKKDFLLPNKPIDF